MSFPIITAEEAASHIKNGDTVGLSGFTAPGVPKDTFDAVAAHAVKEHEAGRPYKISLSPVRRQTNTSTERCRAQTQWKDARHIRTFPTCVRA